MSIVVVDGRGEACEKRKEKEQETKEISRELHIWLKRGASEGISQ